jgi:transposase
LAPLLAARPVALSPERRTGLDGKAAVPLPKPLPPAKKLLADKAHDRAALRDWLARRGTTPVIPNKINRGKPFPSSKRAYRLRDKIERVFCRLKAARRIATRYGKCADNFLSAVCLIAAIYFWLN